MSQTTLMKHPKISVVVPIYKAESFLHCCVDSILAQTFKNFELLLVDDGSPDNSGTICDAYARTDSRVRVFHIANSGANRARALGVSESAGCEYITFVDSDDSLPPTALQELYALANEDYDIIIGSYDRNPKEYTSGEVGKLELVKKIFCSDIASSPYAKLFRKELFDDRTFDLPRDFVMGEDLVMNLRLVFACQRKIRVEPIIVYHYNDNAGGIMNTFNYTLEYVEQSYAVKKNAIPEEYRMQCMPACLYNIAIFTHLIVGHYLYGGCCKKTAFHQLLVDDIQKYNFRQLPVERFALRFSNPLASLIYLLYYRLRGLMKRCKRALMKNNVEKRRGNNG